MFRKFHLYRVKLNFIIVKWILTNVIFKFIFVKLILMLFCKMHFQLCKIEFHFRKIDMEKVYNFLLKSLTTIVTLL